MIVTKEQCFMLIEFMMNEILINAQASYIFRFYLNFLQAFVAIHFFFEYVQLCK